MKKVLVSMLTLMFIISMITVVNAASGSISVNASSNQVVKGNTFTVTVIGNAEENITALQAGLTFDATKLSLEDKTPGKGFGDLSGSNEIAITANDDNSLMKTGTLYTLTFKVLDTATEGETKITVSGAILALQNLEEKDFPSGLEGSAAITIKKDDTTVGDKDNTDKNEDKTPTNTSKDNNKKPTNGKTNTTSKKDNKLPQTGVETVSIVAIAGLSIFAAISYVSYKKYRNI